MAEKNNQDPKTAISNYVDYLDSNEGLTLPSGLGQDQKPPKFNYDEQLSKFAYQNEINPEPYEEKVSFFRAYEAFDDSFMIINDVVLSGVPILYNKMHSTNDVFVAETLRSTAPVVSSSGRQNFTLQLGLLFKPGESQNKLRRLISVLQRFPITYIYNRRVRKSLGISGGDDINTIFILESASMRNASDAIGSIALDLNFHLFNYKPFSNHFWFNTRLPGYKRQIHEFDREKRLIDATGYEQSEFSTTNETIILHEALRELPDLLGETNNVPVPFPSSSDCWMYYADHLENMTPKISERTNDFVSLKTKYFRQYPPPVPEARAGGDDAKHANNTPFESTPYHEFYNAFSHPEVTSSDRRYKKQRAAGRSNTSKTTSNYNGNVKIVNTKNGLSFYGKIIDENGELIEESHRIISKVAVRPYKNDIEPPDKYLDAEIIRRLNVIAERWPNKTIKIVSGIRNYPNGKGPHAKGFAIDIKVDGVNIRDLFLFYATNFQNGFCEYVPVSNFVHIDARPDRAYRSMVLWVDLGTGGESIIVGGKSSKEKNEALLEELKKDSEGIKLVKEAEDILDEAYGMRISKQKYMEITGGSQDAQKAAAQKAAEEERREVDPILNAVRTDSDAIINPDSAFDPDYTIADLERDVKKQTKDFVSTEQVMRDKDIRELWLSKMSLIGLIYYKNDINIRNVFYRNKYFEIDSDKQLITSGNGGIVLSAVSVGFGHRIAAQKLLSQDTASWQFLGAGNKQGTLVFTFAGSNGRQAADEIKKIVYAARESARKFGSTIPEAGTISLGFKNNNTTNSILALISKDMNELDVVVSEIHESTSNSNPDSYQLVLEFIVQEKMTDNGLERSFGTKFEDKQNTIKYILETYVTASDLSNSSTNDWNQWIKPNPDYLVERYNNSEYGRGAIDESNRYKDNGRFARDSGYARPYKLRDPNMPIWVANVIIAAVEVCKEADKTSPATNWIGVDGRRWNENYSDWGAGELIKGRIKNIDLVDRNGLYKFGFEETGSYDLVQVKRKGAKELFEAYFDTKNGGRKYTSGNEYKEMLAGDYQWDNNKSKDNINGAEKGGDTDEKADEVFNKFLAGMDIVYRMVTANMADEENFKKYFGANSDNLYDDLLDDLGGCYDDLYVPNLPTRGDTKLSLPLPPEFFIYDDSYEDPAISSLTDPANMQRHLEEHIDNEIKSVARYIEQSVCGGSYLSRNLPNIAKQRKRHLANFMYVPAALALGGAGIVAVKALDKMEDAVMNTDTGRKALANEMKQEYITDTFGGEMGFMKWESMMSEGCKTWEPVFYENTDNYGDPEKNSTKWMNFILEKETPKDGNVYGTDIQLAWTDKLIKLSPYLRDGHDMGGNSGWQDLGKEETIETIYGNNWRGMHFGPNQIYANADTVLTGVPPSKEMKDAKDKAKEEEDNFSRKRQEAIDAGYSVDVPEFNVTYLDSGDVLIGKSLSTEYNDSLPKDSKPINWWSIADTAVNIGIAANAAVANPIGAFVLKGLWEGGNYVWDAVNDNEAEYVIKNHEKKFISSTHPNADIFAKGTKKMAELSTSIAFANKSKDLSMRRAFPTFKIYFIEDDSHQTDTNSSGQVVKAFDDFYSYSSVQEIRISRNRRVAADMATIRITNIGGKLLRKRWGEREKWVDEENDKNGTEAEYATGIFADTELENPFARMMLQDGVKVQIRLGYANEPHALETVFLGSIVEMGPSEGGKIIEIVCQGFGAELEGVELGPLSDGEIYYSTQQALSSAILPDSIVNFGRRSKYNKFNPGETRQTFTGGEGQGVFGSIGNMITMKEWRDRKLYKHFYKYPFRNFPQDDNIYAPPPSTYANFWDRFWNNACLFRPIKQTPWDIFKEHELRHPGYISLAVPYGHEPRMTMFFGAKGQFYWHNPPSAVELYLAENAADTITRIRGMSADQRTSDQLLGKLDSLLEEFPKLTGTIIQSLVQQQSPASVGKEIGKIFGRYRPFRNYHYFDSKHHILKNTIRTNSNGVYNEVDILYFENENKAQEQDAKDLYDNLESLSLGESGKYSCKLDENIPEQYIRSYSAEFPSCITEFMAKRYAQGLFARLLRDSYKGEFIVLGEATIKPYDICYLNDLSINMTGPVEVEGVEHIFNRDHGWISIITPDLCLDVNDFFSSTLFGVTGDALANAWNAAGSNDIATAMSSLASPIGYLGVMAGVKLGMWMQDGSPVIATPLTLGGKPFVSVSLGQDRVSLITSLKGKWNQYWDDLETAWDKVDVGESIFEKSLDFQEWFYTVFDPSPGEATPLSNGG